MEEHSKHFFKKLYFVWDRFGGGSLIMCLQPFIVCNELNVPSSAMGVREVFENLSNIKDSVLVILKCRLHQSLINQIKNNNNKIIMIPGDGNINLMLTYFKNSKHIDGIVVASKEYKKRIDSLNLSADIRVISHNYDYFLKSDSFKREREKEFRLYFGGSRSTSGPTQGDLGLLEKYNYSEGYFNSLKFIGQNMSRTHFQEREKYALECAFKPKCNVLDRKSVV